MKARQVRGSNDTVTIVAAEAITARRLITVDGKHTAEKAAIGVANFDTDSGDNISVCCGPIEVCEAGDAIAADDTALETDSSGRVVTQSSGVTVGRNIDTAAAAGDMIRVAMGLQ